MRRYFFGKSFVVNYQFVEGCEPSTDSPSIALFSEKPTKDEASTVTGSFKIGSTITSWGNGNYPNTKTITIPAIEDPDPDADPIIDIYYLAINYTLVASGQVQTVIVPFEICRVHGTISGHTVTIDEVLKVFPTIEYYIEAGELESFIAIALQEIEIDLKKKGVRFDQLSNQNDLTYPIALKAAALASHSEFKDNTDKFYQRYLDLTKKYDGILDSLPLHFDNNQDGEPEETQTKKVYYKLNFA